MKGGEVMSGIASVEAMVVPCTVSTQRRDAHLHVFLTIIVGRFIVAEWDGELSMN